MSRAAQEVPLKERSELQRCGGELLGVLHTNPLIAPHEVSLQGGNYYVAIGDVFEVWYVEKQCR